MVNDSVMAVTIAFRTPLIGSVLLCPVSMVTGLIVGIREVSLGEDFTWDVEEGVLSSVKESKQ